VGAVTGFGQGCTRVSGLEVCQPTTNTDAIQKS